MENEMETLGPFTGMYRDITRIMENQMEHNMENDMETVGMKRLPLQLRFWHMPTCLTASLLVDGTVGMESCVYASRLRPHLHLYWLTEGTRTSP